jgi:hypothetical protein
LPKLCRASACSAPSRLVALPLSPSASFIARIPTIANEAPFASSPMRASAAYQPVPACASRRIS